MHLCRPINLLHITAHLGGGVGKVLSRLVAESARRRDGIKHSIACLEAPEKGQFAEHVQEHGGEVIVCPTPERLNALAAQADIVQLEWWHHPVVAGWLCSGELPAMRLVVWSHVSGLHPPEIPPAFLTAPHRFLFTSPCSREHPALAGLAGTGPATVDAVFSSGGFDELPPPPLRSYRQPLRAGYLGTLNFAKLHPHFLEFLAAVRLPGFRVALVGDPTTASELLRQAGRQGVADALEIRGYRSDVAGQLSGFDVLPYLLNPLHYGTTENALLEAMAMGVVPIVLDNPAERHLVRHGETGLVVDSPASFADALDFLTGNPDELRRLSEQAAREIRQRFSVGNTADRLARHYGAVLGEPKRSFDFRPVFGSEPADWFRACIGAQAWRFPDPAASAAPAGGRARGPHYLYEKTKSSAYHFCSSYPGDPRLQRWTALLEEDR